LYCCAGGKLAISIFMIRLPLGRRKQAPHRAG
jgi:hypothetical protein